MTIKRYIQIALVVALMMFSVRLQLRALASEVNPRVAYSSKGVLYLTTESGTVLKVVKARLPIGDFAISPDAQFVIFSEPHPWDVTGGPLWILDISTSSLERMSPVPYKNDLASQKTIEFYSDPEFSPGDKSVVFATHAQAVGDLVETSGPLAVLDFETRKIRILKDTLDSEGFPIGFASGPHWSPDGRQIMVNFEGSAWITDVAGNKLASLVIPEGEHSQSPLSYGMAGIDWLGSKCILYIAGDDPERDPARVLNLTTGNTTFAADLLGLPQQSMRGLVEFFEGLRIRHGGSQFRVDGPAGFSWRVPGDVLATHVHILRHLDNYPIPEACK